MYQTAKQVVPSLKEQRRSWQCRLSRARDGLPVPVPPHERGRKDVYVLGPAESMKVLLRFRDFTGKYLMHCHNLVHEDHAMMIRWDIVP
jgi:FtsP/CotA-like multicopper oxidase with cupredoxin domain